MQKYNIVNINEYRLRTHIFAETLKGFRYLYRQHLISHNVFS